MRALKEAMERAAKDRTGMCVTDASRCSVGIDTRIDVSAAPK